MRGGAVVIDAERSPSPLATCTCRRVLSASSSTFAVETFARCLLMIERFQIIAVIINIMDVFDDPGSTDPSPYSILLNVAMRLLVLS